MATMGKGWVLSKHLKYPVKTLFVYIGAIVELTLYTLPISITADVIELAFIGGGIASVTQKLWLLLALAVIQASLFFCISFVNEILAHRVTTDMTQELFESLQNRSLTYHDQKDVGEIMARATGDIRTVNIALSPAFRFLDAVLALWVIILVIIAQINAWLLVISLGIFFVFIIAMGNYAVKLQPLTKEVREEFAGVSQITHNAIVGIRELKGFVAEDKLKKKFITQTTALRQIEIKSGKKAARFYPMLIVVTFCMTLIVLTTCFAYFHLFGVSFREVILVAGYVMLLYGISRELPWAVDYSVRCFSAAKRIYAIITETDTGETEDGKVNFDPKSQSASIKFEDVSFRYRPDLPLVLENINFKIDQNQTIAIVGGPGSGKSSIAKLIQRLYTPETGRILFGNRDLNEYTNQSLRKFMATVEQDIFLFNKSIFENIRYGKPTATKEEVIQVAKLAKAHSFIDELPEKYDTEIGEKGVKLSGGQAQRISIARALLVDPAILIIDDGASALDSKTEFEILTAIKDILQTHTTIITTHRLAIISQADLLLILEKGQLVGLGTHENLIRTNIYYRRLFEHHYKLPAYMGEK